MPRAEAMSAIVMEEWSLSAVALGLLHVIVRNVCGAGCARGRHMVVRGLCGYCLTCAGADGALRVRGARRRRREYDVAAP